MYDELFPQPVHNLGPPPGFDDDMEYAPFGEEGHDISHAGGDHEVFEDVVVDLARITAPTRCVLNFSLCFRSLTCLDRQRRYDHRTRFDRTVRRVAAWSSQMEALTDAFLNWDAQPQNTTRAPSENERSTTLICIDLFGKRLVLYFILYI